MNKKILAIPVIGAVVAAVAKKMKTSEAAPATGTPAPADGGPDNTTDGQSSIR